MWKLSARVATAEPLIAHEWYYLAPDKGYAVVRAEMFNAPPDGPVNPESTPFRSTIVMEDFRQSPKGFWYPGLVRETNSTADPTARRKPAQKPITMTRVIRYHLDASAAVPDSLFQINDGDRAKSKPSE